MIMVTENMWTVSVYYCELGSGWKTSALLSILLETTMQDMAFEISILIFCISQGKHNLNFPKKPFLGVMLTGIVNLKDWVLHYLFIAHACSQFSKFMIYHENIKVLWAAMFLHNCWKHVVWN